MAKKPPQPKKPAKKTATLKHQPVPQQQRADRMFTPFKTPTRPPAGTYDPALDAQERATGRGLADFLEDTETGRTRATTDYGLGLADIATGERYQTEDMDRGLTRAREDHTSQSGLLSRRYSMLADSQVDQQAAAGVDRGGTVMAALAKRQANQAVDQAPLDSALSRFMEDDARGRLRLTEGADRQRGALGLNYSRAGEDFTEGVERAQRENTQFGLDIGEQRFYQATGAGYTPPSAPAGEHSKGGITYRVSGQGPGRKYVLPNGRQVGRDEWVNMWRWRRSMLARGLTDAANAPFSALGVGGGQLSG